jgi:uridine kinase
MKREEIAANASAPAYSRLVDIILRVSKLHPVRVGIDGIDNAGKTTLADQLVPILELAGRSVIRASIDGFHNPREIRYRLGRRSAEGYFRDSFNLEAVKDELFRPEGDRSFRSAIFDIRADQSVKLPKKIAARDSILLFDGVFLCQPALEACWDLLIYLRVSFATALARGLERDRHLQAAGVNIRELYEERYFPGQRLYQQLCDPEAHAEILVDNNNFQQPRLVRVRRSLGDF